MLNVLDTDSHWVNPESLRNRQYTCGYCSEHVSSDLGYRILNTGREQVGGIYLCPSCAGPTFFSPRGDQVPTDSVPYPISHVPDNLYAAFEEAYRCKRTRCYNAAVLLCQQIISDLAVEHGAGPHEAFFDHLLYLDRNNHIPPQGHRWVDYVGQELTDVDDAVVPAEETMAESFLRFTEMLLRFNFEFPEIVSYE